jgi:Inner membrane component of T3SS, cytoplasmic domain
VKACPKCSELSPDTAVACQQCGTVLDASVIARAAKPSPSRAPTLVEDVRPTPPPPRPLGGRRGDTSLMPPSETQMPTHEAPSPSAPPARASERKIVGVLVTYTWSPQGQVFPVREGRNLIGRGEQCEIRVPGDSKMSDVNSHITYRQRFVVGDMVSEGGTYLDGQPIEEQFVPLQSYARIRTGSTQWTFIALDPTVADSDTKLP